MYVASFSQVGQEFGQVGHGQDQGQGQVGLGQVQQIGAPAVSASTLSVAQGIITG